MAFPTTDGGVVETWKHLGKVVCLEFILTTCPHCQETSRILQRMQDTYGPRGFEVFAVATNPMSHMLIPDFKKEFMVRFPVAYSPSERANEYLQHPSIQIMYMPQLVFIDRKGYIQRQVPGGDSFFNKPDQEKNIRAQIEKLLASK
jgi:thiol-disulfide isomerase/thioredoxin